ncbi:MAG TPA: alanine racemase [Cellvibrionaceae bacterium]
MSRSYPILNVDLAALASNYRLLQQRAAGARVGAVVKANAYGLGVEAVAGCLYERGCRDFFVSSTEEGVALRPLVPAARIFVLQGVEPGDEGSCQAFTLTPVLISSTMAQRYLSLKPTTEFALKVNTGMNRLGLEPAELLSLLPRLPPTNCQLLMSHLACADEPGHALNVEQLRQFHALAEVARAALPQLQLSLANSAGIFLGGAYHFDVVRPGAALYGINPGNLASDVLSPVAQLLVQVIQTRTLSAGDCVGYGATFVAERETPVVMVSGGYADGLMRALSQKGCAWFKGKQLPLIGRVSMDSLVFDVSLLPQALRPVEGDRLEVFGPNVCIDAQAQTAGTIGYEIFTRLGDRCQRLYLSATERV